VGLQFKSVVAGLIGSPEAVAPALEVEHSAPGPIGSPESAGLSLVVN
jgi:hypothetical protein